MAPHDYAVPALFGRRGFDVRRLLILLCLLAIGIGLRAGCAQSSAQAPAPVETTVTVTGDQLPLAAESASVTVIPQEALAASLAENAAELLSRTPDLNVQQQGGDAAFTTITVRGGKPNQLLVLLDGVPVNDLSNELGGSYDFSSLPLINIERVEVVRGPMSSVYGSEAVSGVVNFITKKGSRPASFALDDSFGSFGAAQGAASAAGGLGRADYALGASAASIGTQIGNDSAALYAGNASLNLPVDARRFATVVSRYNMRHADEFPTGSGGPLYALDRAAETDRTGDLVLGAAWQHQYNDVWLYRIEGDGFRKTARSDAPPILDAIPPSYNSQPSSFGHTRFARVELRGTNTFSLSTHWSARLAAGWRRESGVNRNILYGYLPDDFSLVRNTGETVEEISFTSARAAVTAGVGTSTTPGFGTVGSPRVGGSFRVTGSTRLKATFGQAFALPSFYSYAEPLVGNPHLQPEHLRAWDAGVEQAVSPYVNLSATWYHDHYTNLITFSSAVFKLVNLNSVDTQGAELAANLHVRRVEMRAWGSYLDWTVHDSTEPLRNQPHGQGGVSIDWKPNARLLIGGDVLAMGARYDYEVPVPLMDKADEYSTTTLRAQWVVRGGLTAHVRVGNLFNQDYQQFVGFPDPGIRVRAGISWSGSQRGGAN
jgi:outer membrane cobalamin receptor